MCASAGIRCPARCLITWGFTLPCITASTTYPLTDCIAAVFLQTRLCTTSTHTVQALLSSTEVLHGTLKGHSTGPHDKTAGALGLADSENNEASGLGVSQSGATLDRPGTTQRSGGRVAMTVLRPQQQQQQQAATALPQLPTPSTAQQAAAVPPQAGAASHSLRRSFLGAKQVSWLLLQGWSAACMFAQWKQD